MRSQRKLVVVTIMLEQESYDDKVRCRHARIISDTSFVLQRKRRSGALHFCRNFGITECCTHWYRLLTKVGRNDRYSFLKYSKVRQTDAGGMQER